MWFSPGSYWPGSHEPQQTGWNVTPRSALREGKFLRSAQKGVQWLPFSEAKMEIAAQTSPAAPKTQRAGPPPAILMAC
jgi:hypothetical protein